MSEETVVATNGYLKVAVVLGAVAVLPLAACSSDGEKTSVGDTVTRAATGDVATNGGARRENGDQSQAIRDAIASAGAKNVIMLLGDGMGDSEITVARNYEKGAGGFFTGLDAFPLTGQYTTYALDKDGKPNYVTDSAASATAWSTGTKTYNGALGIDIKGNPQKTILELAKDQGFATGDITTSEIQDATPAALFSHITERDCYGPEETAKDCTKEALENGGLGSVTEQLLTTRPDITMGGGAETFAQTANGGDYKGKTLEVQAKERGFQIVRTASELDGIGKADQDAPLLGLFADGNMPVSWTGPARGAAGLSAAGGQVHRQPRAGCGGAGTGGHDEEDHRPAHRQRQGQGQGLLPPGGERVDRQARPCRGSLRSDRRDRRTSTKRCRRPSSSRRRTATPWSSRRPTTDTPVRSSRTSPRTTSRASPRTPSCRSNGSATSCTRA